MIRTNTFESRQIERGFTLIELLVVIAIIAILAAILFPVFEKAREKALQTACLSNTKQLALGVIQYVQDYDENMPLGQAGSGCGTGGNNVLQGIEYQRYATSATGPCYDWTDAIYPYVKSQGVYTCPAPAPTQSANSLIYNYIFSGSASPNAEGAYSANAFFSGMGQGTGNNGPICVWGQPPVSMGKIVAPAGLFLLADGAYNCCGYYPGFVLDLYQAAPGWNSCSLTVPWLCNIPRTEFSAPSIASSWNGPLLSGRHNGLINVAFCDGHSKAMLPGVLATTVGPNGGPSYFVVDGG